MTSASSERARYGDHRRTNTGQNPATTTINWCSAARSSGSSTANSNRSRKPLSARCSQPAPMASMPSSLEVLDCPLAGVTLIEASAGTGKTWTICGLYLRAIVEKRIDVRQLLVVTFTKAATAELQERLRRRLAEIVRALADGTTAGADRFVIDYARRPAGGAVKDTSPAEALDSGERALRCFDEAAGYTIHGFCQRPPPEAPFAPR